MADPPSKRSSVPRPAPRAGGSSPPSARPGSQRPPPQRPHRAKADTGRDWPPLVEAQGSDRVVPSEPVFQLPPDAVEAATGGTPAPPTPPPQTAVDPIIPPMSGVPGSAFAVGAGPASGGPGGNGPKSAVPASVMPRPSNRPPPLSHTNPGMGVPAPSSSGRVGPAPSTGNLPPPAPSSTSAVAGGRTASGPGRVPPPATSSRPAAATGERPSLRPSGANVSGGGSLPPPRGATPATFGTVAFLGTGGMGLPMAANIAKKGFALSVWNRSRDRAGALAEIGAKVKPSPAECVQNARVVFTMLADEKALIDVLTGPNGVLTTLASDAVLVDMSTLGRAGALRVAQLVKDAGGRFVDAPVVGSPGAAERAELLAVAGGKLNDITRAQPVMQTMCKRILHVGDVGQGQALRVLLSSLAADQLVALTSAIALGEKLGIARRSLLEAFAASPYVPPAFAQRKEKLLARDYTPETPLDVYLREARLSAELQQEAALPLAVSRETLRTLEKASEEGLGAEDAFALEKYFKL